MDNDTLLQADKISLKYGNKIILENISFNLDQHDFITIVGPNGAGKTSLVKILLGLVKATSGAIISSKKLKIGYLAQNLQFNTNLPINSTDFLRLSSNNKQLINQTMERTDISHLAKEQIHTLSQGQKQSLLLARAILNNPDLLILDEPTQNMDIASQDNFYKLLDDFYSKSLVSVLMISHDLHLVMKDTKKVLCLFKHLCCQGKPQEIAQDPQFVQIFGHDVIKELAWYKHSSEHDCQHTHI